jgi:hypothetical protein
MRSCKKAHRRDKTEQSTGMAHRARVGHCLVRWDNAMRGEGKGACSKRPYQSSKQFSDLSS